jgi:chromosome partitioning protein
MLRILVASPKGGCGKSTVAANLAVHYARAGRRAFIIDCDHQGSCVDWARARGAAPPPIPVLASADSAGGWTLKVPPDTGVLLIDTPAGLRRFQIADLLRRVDAVVVPVVPSALDLRATLPLLAELKHVPAVRDGGVRIALLANRVKPRTIAARELAAMAQQLAFPLVAALRDTQAYVLAGALGRSVFDYASAATQPLRDDWQPLLGWLEIARARPAAAAPAGVVVPFPR